MSMHANHFMPQEACPPRRHLGAVSMLNLTIVMLLLLVTTHALFAATYPDLPQIVKPNPEPAFPAGFDTFSPPVDASTPGATTPTIAEWLRTAEPDQSVVATGHQFSTFTGADAGKDTHFLVYGQTATGNGVLKPARIQRLNGDMATLTLDSDLPSWAMYLLWPRNANGYGVPITINRTEAWWLGPKKATRGETTAVYGRNLSHDNGTTTSWVYIKTGPTTMTAATVMAVNPNKVDFTVPSGLTNGDYEVWIHNGHGGSYGWSGPLTLTVYDGPNWNGATFNVTSYGAVGDGSTDDTAAIQAAYTAAKQYRDGNPGMHPTVYFPAGIYLVSGQFTPESNIRWLGAGKDVTTIQRKSDSPVHYILVTPGTEQTNVEIKDLTLSVGEYRSDWYFVCANLKMYTGLRVTNVVIDAKRYGVWPVISLTRSSEVFLKNCEFIGGRIWLGREAIANSGGKQIFIDSCVLKATNDITTAVFGQGTEDVSVTNCVAQDYDNTQDWGWNIGRFYLGNGEAGANRNTYLGNNVTIDLCPRPGLVDQNVGEQFLWELNRMYYQGTPTSATSTTVTFTDLSTDHTKLSAVIVKGKGLGQYRRITGYSAGTKTITVDPAWNVTPDNTSLILIGALAERVAIYANTIDGKDRGVTSPTHIASAGIEPFGGCMDFAVAKNTINQVRCGIATWGLISSMTPATVLPSFFHLYSENIVQNCRWGIEADTKFYNNPGTDPGTALLGAVFRDNAVASPLLEGMSAVVSWTGLGKPMAMTVFEHNTGTNVGVAMNTSGCTTNNVGDVITYKNYFSRGTAAYSGSKAMNFAANQWPGIRENTWSGYETTYAGAPPGPILEVPVRVLEVSGTPGLGTQSTTLTLWNAGTSSLSWNATDDANWLSLSSVSGSIANEKSKTVLTVTCDPGALSAGTYTGVITITCGQQTKKVTVRFELTPVTPSAAFVKTDTTTSGNWKGVYGGDGNEIIQDSTPHYPAYATVSYTGDSTWTWDAAPVQSYALQRYETGRIAACRYASTNFTVDINLTDGLPHQVAFYCVDWGSITRSQRIEITDVNDNQLCTPQTISSFNYGKYLVFTLKGHVKVKFVNIGTPNAVVSGIFFDPANTAAFVTTDTTTRGNWQGVYGGAGSEVILDSTHYPAYTAVSYTGSETYLWDPAPTQTQALQRYTTGRIAACKYSVTDFTVDVNLTDGLPHQVAFYCVDWGSVTRSQQIEIYDADTNTQLCPPQAISSFTTGKYLVFTLKGHVKVKFVNTGTPNAVVSGIFFD